MPSLLCRLGACVPARIFSSEAVAMVDRNVLPPVIATLFAYCFQEELVESLLLFRIVQRASFFTIHEMLEFLKIVAQLTHKALYPIDVIFF